MKFLLLLAQAHEEFRLPELQALAELEGLEVDFSNYSLDSPFLELELDSEQDARKLVHRSILTKAVYALIAQGRTPEEMHADNKSRPEQFEQFRDSSFKFEFVSFHGKRPKDQQNEILRDFEGMDLRGPIDMKNPQCLFTIIEKYIVGQGLQYMWFTKFVCNGDRHAIDVYNLKKRPTIGTTSFDAELSLVTCNMAKIQPYDFVFDPFSGTGSFPVAAAYYKALSVAADIDFRSLRGYEKNFIKYGTSTYFMDPLCMDFTHPAFREGIKFDAIISDPPYGVREGLKVCGARDPEKYGNKLDLKIDNELAHLRRDYVQPKRPYEFELLLQDILNFAAERLKVSGRLAFWLPLPEKNGQPQFPKHKHLKLISSCPQSFNKWTRWLLTYERRPHGEEGEHEVISLEDFRKHYFTPSREIKRN